MFSILSFEALKNMRKISVKPPQMKKEGGLRLQFQHGKFFRPNNYHRGISNQPTNRRSIF
jgi:hypothetical protein